MSTLFDGLDLPARPGRSTALPATLAPRPDEDEWVPPEPPPEDDAGPSDELPAQTDPFADLPLPASGAELPGKAVRDAARAAAARSGSDRSEELLVGLNPQQRQAVTHAGSPLLIVAGAGSGKTRVLTHRVAHLLATGRARPGEILAITFTNKAAAEMRERVEDIVGASAQRMWVSTFHSACVRILRREHEALGMRSSFSIYDSADSQRLITLVARELDVELKRFPAKLLARKISDLKNELIDPDDHASSVMGSGQELDEVVSQVYRGYDARLRQASAMDFDDLIMRTVHLLQAFPAIAEHYHRRFLHVLVDEYQDTNHAQYVLVRELSGGTVTDPGGLGGQSPVEPAELTVVGDADQSIYAFRGATIRNILEFEADYPDARTILLEQNYRSTQTILSAANSVISPNPGRRAKNLWTDSGSGPRIVGYVADSEHEEARFVVEEIDRLRDDESATTGGPGPGARGLRYGDMAIFYRTNQQSRALEEVLVRAGVPYVVVGGTRFYERREIKDAVAYLRAVANPDDEANLRRIINVPRRGLGAKAEEQLERHAARERVSYGQAIADAAASAGEEVDGRTVPEVLGLATRSRTAVRGFHELMSGLREMLEGGSTPAEILDAALDRSGYLAELRASEDPQDASRVENLAELHAVAQEFAEADPEATLGDFLERVALVADADQIPGRAGDEGVVTLMTVHTAKGLEFPVVFVTGLEDGTFPHQRSLGESDQIAEERRLAYVALTRARERLYLSRAAVRTAFGLPQEMPESRFVSDIPPELVEWRREQSSTDAIRGSGRGGDGRTWASSVRVSRAEPRTAGGSRGSESSRGSGGSRGSGVGTSGTWKPGGTVRKDGEARFGSANPRPDVEIPALSPGDRVNHDAYGLGTVVSLENPGPSAVAKVDFGGGQVKRLLLRYAPVTKL
ncbi:MAG: UvrD-helicase domain-containing protein [Actinomycetales bacterium]